MRGFQPQDLYSLSVHADPRISPDGSRVAFVVQTLDEEKNIYPSAIWTVALKGGEARRLTKQTERAHRPRWSPDGRRIAFVSHPAPKKTSLAVIGPGRKRRELATFQADIEEIEWSPRGDRIAVVARDPDPDVYEVEKPKDAPARRIDRISYRLDNEGWTIDRPKRIFVVDARGRREPFKPTPDGFQESGVSWSPDGKEIAFCSARHDTWDFDLFVDLYAVRSTGGEPELLTRTDSSHASAAWGPDDWIACQWRPNTFDNPRHTQIKVINRQTRAHKILTGALDRNAALFPPGRPPAWSERAIFFQIEDSGDAPLYRVTMDADPERVFGGGNQLTGFDVRGDAMAMTVTDPSEPPRLYIRRGRKRPVKVRLPEPRKRFTPSEPIPFQVTSLDGTKFEAWVVPPAGLQKRRRYPALLSIHGGPFTQYGNKFFDEFQCYSGAGYAVIYCNPRGSSGYSEEWGRAIRGRKVPNPGAGWASVDYEDLIAATEAAVEQFPFIDSERLGVMGGSYGGYMTSLIVGRTNMFKAACSERSVNNMLTMCYTCDLSSYFSREFGLYLDEPEEYLQMSPITYVRNIETPLLILHSENDLRCPIEQAEQLYMAMRLLDKEVEFVRFPEEGHEMSRAGAPRHRVERFQIILDWFDRHLKNAPAKPARKKVRGRKTGRAQTPGRPAPA